MGSQKVPGMVELHCKGKIYGDAYIITFKVGPLNAHTCCIKPAIVRSTGRRILLKSSGVRPSHWILVPLCSQNGPVSPIFRVGNSKTSLGARSGECGGWVLTGIAAQQALCGSVRYREASRNHCPCLPPVAPLPPNGIAQAAKLARRSDQ
jgi:hypothetical protein